MKKVLFIISLCVIFLSCNQDPDYQISNYSTSDVTITASGGSDSGTYTINAKKFLMLKLNDEASIITSNTSVYIVSQNYESNIYDIPANNAKIINRTGIEVTVTENRGRMKPNPAAVADDKDDLAPFPVALFSKYSSFSFSVNPSVNTVNGVPYKVSYNLSGNTYFIIVEPAY